MDNFKEIYQGTWISELNSIMKMATIFLFSFGFGNLLFGKKGDEIDLRKFWLQGYSLQCSQILPSFIEGTEPYIFDSA